MSVSELTAIAATRIRRAMWDTVAGVVVVLGAAVALSACGGSAAAPRLGPVRHVSANGLSIGYRTGGSGPWLILVMGRSGTMAAWDPLLIKQLIGNHRVLIFDNRGMGTTSNNAIPPSQVTIPLMAKDTLALADALHIEHFDLMGWSMGGEISQQVTVDAPGRVMKLVLCATSAGGPSEQPPSPSVAKVMNEPSLPARTLLKLSFPPKHRRSALAYAARVYAQYVRDRLPKDSFAASTAGKAGQAHARQQWTSETGGVYNHLPTLNTHVLIMWGNLDVIGPPANDQLIAKQLRHATTKVFNGAGHAFLFQDAVQVGQTADKFLG
jgi:pimeloyl-ACP methyl ester carboxylesterase